MDRYRNMYYKLFNKITDVIIELQTIQMETEEIFLSQKSEQKVLQIPVESENTD